MIAEDEDLFICDMAETYHVFNWRELPLSTAAALAFGLSEDSRIRRKMSGQKCTANQLLLAMAVDRLSLLWWAQTKDGHNNENRPQMIAQALAGQQDKPKDFQTFDSAEEFYARLKELQKGGD